LRIEVTRASRGLSAIAELLVLFVNVYSVEALVMGGKINSLGFIISK